MGTVNRNIHASDQKQALKLKKNILHRQCTVYGRLGIRNTTKINRGLSEARDDIDIPIKMISQGLEEEAEECHLNGGNSSERQTKIWWEILCARGTSRKLRLVTSQTLVVEVCWTLRSALTYQIIQVIIIPPSFNLGQKGQPKQFKIKYNSYLYQFNIANTGHKENLDNQ
ncbi:hypothetical protein RF11_04435 [Thelohanellus kitauei]|uniref:Uncharacterized protein n=1 Tax=Thelohanellus kitauei TaxID=669202 RepID=A0A0C2MN50_THEKT|nr:hypothetical protein RF11_04435 [Thelohanellus kitauei]